MENIFEGPQGRKNLISALCQQELVKDDRRLAEKLAESIEIIPIEANKEIIRQDDPGNEMFFILSGEVSILVNGRVLTQRRRGEQVGEMALVDVGAPRAATVVGQFDCVLGKISRESFLPIANEYPQMWERISVQLARRLRERNSRERNRNETPRIFIGSSSEGRNVLNGIEAGLSGIEIELRPWTLDGLFAPSEHPMEALEREVETSDFAIMVFSADDMIFSRWRTRRAVRDNVLFELGLFMGALGRKRSFIVQPRNKKLRLASDLQGLTTLRYGDETDLTEVCGRIKREVSKEGPI